MLPADYAFDDVDPGMDGRPRLAWNILTFDDPDSWTHVHGLLA